MTPTLRLALLVIGSASIAQAQNLPLPTAVSSRSDALGDPLPPGALMRFGTIRWRPSGYIHHLAFSPDGKRLASWHDEHVTTAAATIWETTTGRELRRIELPGASIATWNWVADGRGVSVIHTSDGPYVWEFSDVKTVPQHTPPTFDGGVKTKVGGRVVDNEQLSAFAVSPDGSSRKGLPTLA